MNPRYINARICYDCVSWSGGGEPATQEGGSTFITHWDTPGVYTVTAHCCGANFSKQVTIYKVDLIVDGVPEEQEVEPGKYIGVNNDDDNTNSIADYAETGTVANEDDLVKIIPSITPALSSGSAMLEAFYEGDVCPIKLWLNPTKGCELPLYQDMEGHSLVAWNLSQETLPEKLYVEGYRAGDVALDFSYNNVAWGDSAVFHVVDVDIISPVGSLSAPINPVASWQSTPCYHFDFQCLVSGATGTYNISPIVGSVAPSLPLGYKWMLDDKAGTLTNDTTPTPTHGAPAAPDTGTLRLKAMNGTASTGVSEKRGIMIYLDHLARDYANFGTDGNCAYPWNVTTFNVNPQPVMDTWNCHGSTNHAYNGTGNGNAGSIFALVNNWAVKTVVVTTHDSSGNGSHPNLGTLERGDVVAYFSPNGKPYNPPNISDLNYWTLQHSQTCTGSGDETYGANNEPVSFPGDPLQDQSWKWATSPAGDWGIHIWQPGQQGNLVPFIIVVFEKP